MSGPAVMSSYWVFDPLMNSPITLNATVPPVGTAFGPELDTLVLVAAGRGVNVADGVAAGDLLEVGVGVNVGEAGGPFAIVMDSSAKPGAGVGEEPPPPPPQLSIIAPKTNNTTGATTSHLSHRENIKL
ncbi:hypothetical protein [Candidatus Binatus sp.]|uniref:hypothetical protein n=1 Tax=Candidatus Binatus sp. TaxID=2811406 RepID=UPI003BCE15E6